MDTRPHEWFLVSFALGATVAASAAVALMTLGLHATFVDWLKEWSTLLTGFMALVAALITVVYIQRQIEQTRAQESERRERQHYAARATLPAALADLVEYADAALVALKAVPLPTGSCTRIRVAGGWACPTQPRVPSEAVAVLKACIETAELGPREEMAKLLAHLQICNTRLKGLFEDLSLDRRIVTTNNMHHYLGDFLELYLRSDRMIRYARSEEPEITINITLGDMTTRAIHSDLEHYPGLSEALAKRYNKAPEWPSEGS